ncbi:MAG: DUF4147 domain-containing protein, partial [Thiohalocapsa sp.]
MRRDARAAFDAAVAAAQPRNLVPGQIQLRGNDLLLADQALPRSPGRHVVVAIGKAAPGMAAAWLECVSEWTNELYVLAPHDVPIPPEVENSATVLRGAHPSPDAAGEASTCQLLEVARSLGADDVLVVLLSGGGSALLAAPEEGLELDDISTTTGLLLRSGAPIEEINTVRRQLLAAAGGGLGLAAFPAEVQTLILSDVVGDALPDIASGPTVPSSSTAADALAVFDRRRLRPSVPPAVIDFLESAADRSPGIGALATAHSTRVIGNNRTAVDAAALELRSRTYEVTRAAEPLIGEASVRGRELALAARALESTTPSAVVVGGETTVTVRGSGRGGRNQELALAAAIGIDDINDIVVLAAGTDGIDGVSENAGAIIDS